MTTVPTRTLRCLLATAAALVVLAGCSSDDDPSESGGLGSPRAAVDAHIDAARAYDIEGDCNLLTPDRRSELAALDGLEVDTYCATVTAPIEADADDATRANTRTIYTDPTVTKLDRPDGTWFSMVSTDGSYSEEIQTVEVDGRWWIGTIDSDIADEDHDHAGEDPPGSGDPATDTSTDPSTDGATPTSGG